MKYEEARMLVEKNRHLIGKKYKGRFIDEIIIYPIDPMYLAVFKQEYYSTLDAVESIKPFIDFEVNVTAIVDKKMIVEDNMILFVSLEDLENDLVK